ncbi:hypothetical protein LGM65_26675 [Burkholderia anthina]|uniref:hypothetical protein n=1 Tax=Burkholderia anthina TaxID=179879 RepID=UPI001CF1A81F|nr:hypothetical protein [Burkholderia anthina]MCA8094416.1 hypothetical protein [Burkholderia anthina]
MEQVAIHKESSDASMLSNLRRNASVAWSYDVASNYMDGCRSGSAAAIAYMQFAKARPKLGGGTLQSAAIYFAEALRDARTKGEAEAIRGKMVGFFSAIDAWLDFAVKRGTDDSMEMPFDAIVAMLDDAATGNTLRAWDESCAKVRSEQARAAAKARWSKQRRTA